MASPLYLAQPRLQRRLPESNRWSPPLGNVSARTPKPYANRHGYVYVVEAAGERIKIGWSANPANRVRLLESETRDYVHVWAVIPGTPADEGRLHDQWSHLRIEGEWFHADSELLAWAETLA